MHPINISIENKAFQNSSPAKLNSIFYNEFIIYFRLTLISELENCIFCENEQLRGVLCSTLDYYLDLF